MTFRPTLFAALCATMILPGFAFAQQTGPRDYVIATASESGTYYPVGVALALVTRVHLQAVHGIGVQALPSAGSAENVSLLRDGTAQFAFMQALVAHWAHQGAEPFSADGPQDNLRAVTMLWPDVSHFLIRAELAETGTVDDLANLEGLSFSIGALGSGTEISNRFLLGNYGFDTDSWSLALLPFDQAVAALQEGTIAGANIEAGIGVDVVRRALTQMEGELTLLSVTEEQAQRFDNESGWVATATIPPDTYPTQDTALNSIALPNVLAVDAAVPEEDVYQIIRTLFENLPYLCELHPATCAITPETAMDGLPIPLHPGAERYFREIGLAFPDDVEDPDEFAE
jgi:uncharacterized protein